jgi:uncharacterized protein YutE (UPF0331/DUF86 family)
MIELGEMIKIADVHAERIKMALAELEQLLPFNADKVELLAKDKLLLTDLLVHRFGKLQDLLGNKIINEFLKFIDEYAANLSMLDKIYKLERLEIIEDAELWKEMRKVRNHITHEYPDHPDFTAADLNKIIELAPHLLKILDNIKIRIKY